MRFRTAAMAAVILTFVAGTATGQNLGNKVSMTYSVQPSPHVTVTNNYSSRLTGMVVIVPSAASHLKTTEIIWLDPGINFHRDHPLETGDSKSFQVGPVQLASQLQPQLMAVAFEDGTSAGDPQWLSKLHLRRKAAYDEIAAVTGLLNQALAEHRTKDQIISALNSVHDSLKTSIAEPESRIAARLVVEMVIDNLERGGIRGAIGDPEKTIPATIFPLFGEWRGALKRYDKSVG